MLRIWILRGRLRKWQKFIVCETIGSGKIKTVIDIPEDLASFGYNPEMIIRLDSKKLMQLGWKATIGLEEMFERLIKGMKK